MGWTAKLDAASQTAASLVCVGLDPDPARMPVRDVVDFNKTIIDATSDLVCAYKPNLAFYEALGLEGLRALRDTVRHIRAAAPGVVIVGDGKRGDIDSTAAAYAKAMFEVWDFDAVTVNPYLGWESVEPFLAYEGRGAIILCRTSNPGAPELQDVPVADDGRPLFLHVADMIESWNRAGNLGMVFGATYPEQLSSLRAAHPAIPLLIPGVGAQGADVAGAARAGVGRNGRGMMISSSRGVLYASGDGEGYGDAARAATEALRLAINEALDGAA